MKFVFLFTVLLFGFLDPQFARAQMDAPEVIDFGNVQAGGKKEYSFKIINPYLTKISVDWMQIEGTGFSFTGQPTATIPPDSTYVKDLIFQSKATDPNGVYEGKYKIYVTDPYGTKLHEYKLKATVVREFP